MENENVYQLIQNLTQFLEDWRNGVHDTKYSFFSDLLNPNFTLIMYNGMMVNDHSLEQIMTTVYGKSNVKISIESYHSREFNDFILSTYIEKHQYDNKIERSHVSVFLNIVSMKLIHMQVTSVLA